MQQILLSSQNILPNQAKVQGGSAVNQSGQAAFISPNSEEASISRMLGGSQEIKLNQGVKESFLDILNTIELPQGSESMEDASLAGWKNLLNENPELFEQLEQNPEVTGQLQAFIEGQYLSKEGEVLPPLQEGEVLAPFPEIATTIINQPILNKSNSLEAELPLASDFLSDQDPIQVTGESMVAINLVNGAANNINNGASNVSMPYALTGQGDLNGKTWGRFSASTQANTSPMSENSAGAGAGAGRENLSLNLNGTASVAPMVASDSALGFLQGGAGVTNLQSETDVQFKSSFDSFSVLDAESGDVLDAVRGAERSETSRTQFSDIQSKLQGTGLKQYSMSLETNVQDPDWGDAMGQKIVWLTGRAIQSAEIHLNPADLGPIEVKINVQNEQASVTFHAQNSTVRDMLESNVHRLRDMMESNGVDLAEVSVGSEDSGSQYSAQDSDDNEAGQNGESHAGGSNELMGDVPDEVLQTTGVSNRIVDFYA
jgi:hypothetical protein